MVSFVIQEVPTTLHSDAIINEIWEAIAGHYNKIHVARYKATWIPNTILKSLMHHFPLLSPGQNR